MLLQRLAISEVAMVDMAMEDMVAMGATGMERDLLKLKLNQDIPEDMEDMDMEVDTMARGKLAMVFMDMVVMAVHMEVMVDMDIAVKFVPLFIISPPPSLIFLLVLRQKHE